MIADTSLLLPPTAAPRVDTTVLPFVSIIIPVFNDSQRLRRCLDALTHQSYAHDRYEIIVVDNGSSEDIGSVVGRFPGVVFGREPQPGSYAARNTALALAKGEVLAFTDSDCLPDKEWLAHGVAALRRNPAVGLIAGQVKLFYQQPERPTSVELFERVTAFPQHKYVDKYHYGATANVFTWRSLFDTVGPFNAALTSGGDREWGQRVHSAGYQIGYADDVVVQHPARRTFGEMYRKVARVTGGLEDLRARRRYSWWSFAKALVKDVIPPTADLAAIWRDGRLRGSGQRLRACAVLLALRYAQAWVRLRSRFTRARVR